MPQTRHMQRVVDPVSNVNASLSPLDKRPDLGSCYVLKGTPGLRATPDALGFGIAGLRVQDLGLRVAVYRRTGHMFSRRTQEVPRLL